MSSETRVVVTGMGVISPAGRGVEESWQGVLSGKTAARPDPQLEEMQTPVTIACRVPAFDADVEVGRGAYRRMDRYTHLAVIAATEALAQSGFAVDGEPDASVAWDRVGVVFGSGIGGAETWQGEYPNYLTNGAGKVSPMFIPKMLSNTAAGVVSIRTGARGPNMSVNTACAAGASAIHMGRDFIRAGSADAMIVGGLEAGITGLSVSAFARMGALSRNDDPETASRPFDVDRDGFVMGEGAGVLIIESEEHAKARGAQILAVVAGCGASADAHHITSPPDDGDGAVLAMRRALEDAGMTPDVVGHINAHGTSTPPNDVAEGRAIHQVFGDRAAEIPVTSTKGVTGHMLGAGGAVEAIFAISALRAGVVPPTAGLRTVDPEIELDVVHNGPREHAFDAVMSNSFGFGGQNAALLFTR